MSKIESRRFVVYADFNCPFCYALNERIHALDLAGQVSWRPIQHAPSISSSICSYETLCELTSEVQEVRRRAPSTEIRVPTFRPNSEIASALINRLQLIDGPKAAQLRRAIYRALWVDGEDISNLLTLERLLHRLAIVMPVVDVTPQTQLIHWQQQWTSNSQYERNIPILIEKGGETIIGFPPQAELESFLRTGVMNSTTEIHGICVLKPRQRLLMLDQDVESIRMVIEQMRAYQVDVVKDCQQLMARLEERELPDLALLDMTLLADAQHQDWRFCLNSTELGHSIPVILVSADHSIPSEIAAFESGAADYISKPFHPQVLKARLALHLAMHRSQQLLDRMARFDSLTEIPNRREFDLRLLSEWERGARAGTSLTLLIIDVDFFKPYNDHYGHPQGDDCLAAVARILHGCMLRTSDLMARYGGEEFVALLPETTPAGAMAIAKRCLSQIAAARIPHDTSTTAPYVTVSIGGATTTPSHAHEARMLVESADNCLYQAKKSGRNQVCMTTFNLEVDT